MKIIFLNSWFGKAGQPFYDFLKEHAPSTDVFCFMEISNGEAGKNLDALTSERPVGKQFEKIVRPMSSSSFQELSAFLLDFKGKFDRSDDLVTKAGNKIPLGLASFVRRGIKVKFGVERVNEGSAVPHCFERIMQTMCVEKNRKNFWINSIHGVSLPGSKRDTKERLLQSKNICKILRAQKGDKVLGGDFNLMPNTRSVKLIEEFGMRNLIKEFKIKETRSEISHSQYPGRVRQHFADFAFVSRKVRAKSFEVPRVNASDHLPLILEIE